MSAMRSITVGLVTVIVDGVAAKHLADAWAVAPPEEAAAALRVVLGEETINFALAALFNVLFAGVTFVLYGLAVAWSQEHPPWVGWIVVAAGAGSIVVGTVQAAAGESTPFTRTATIHADGHDHLPHGDHALDRGDEPEDPPAHRRSHLGAGRGWRRVLRAGAVPPPGEDPAE